MKPKQIIKIIIDILMTGILLFLMAYSLVGEAAHEWLGISMFVLFVVHHILNSAWSRNVFKGRYTPYRIWQTVLVILALIAMAGSMISGIVISRHVFTFLPITGGWSWARTLHMLSGYWGFAFISLHLGLHWSMMVGMAKRMFQKPSAVRARIVRITGWLIVLYGIYAFVHREVLSYMLLQNQFVFFDFEEPLIWFLLDYMAIMGMFVFIGHYAAEGIRRIGKKPKAETNIE